MQRFSKFLYILTELWVIFYFVWYVFAKKSHFQLQAVQSREDLTFNLLEDNFKEKLLINQHFTHGHYCKGFKARIGVFRQRVIKRDLYKKENQWNDTTTAGISITRILV